MAVDNPVATGQGPGQSDARTVRDLLRSATTATLATIERTSGYPFGSLVQIATLADAAPVFLISGLARHTQNLIADPRSSLLVDRRTASASDPLAIERATLVGRARRIEDESAMRRLLARHPSASGYAGFADFALWTLDIERAHLVAGFGRIREIAGADVRLSPALVAPLAASEPRLLDGLERRLVARSSGAPLRVVGLDLEGLDVERDGRLHRLPLALTPPIDDDGLWSHVEGVLNAP